MDVAIRVLDKDNAALLARVAEDVFDQAIPPDRFAAYLETPGHRTCVAVADGMVIGQAQGMIHKHPDESTMLYVDNLEVAPAFQRRGIATRLMKKLMDWGKAEGCTLLWVATEADNAAGQAFYASLGLKPQKMVYFEGALDGTSEDKPA